MIYTVYQQHAPVKRSEFDNVANLVKVGTVDAKDGAAAIHEAYTMPEFAWKPRKDLSGFPVVEAER